MKLLKEIKRSFRRGMFAIGMVRPLAKKLARSVRTMGPEDGEFTLFALKPERFRGDLDILADQFGFRILSFKKGWQQKILELFWDDKTANDHSYYAPAEGSHTRKVQLKVRAFLKKFLPVYFDILGVDCVLAAATYYLDDWDYAAVCDDIGFPFVVIYRECLQASQKDIDFQVELCTKLRRFQGSHLLLHNAITEKAMIDCGYVEQERVSAPGCMRMDPFIQAIRDGKGRDNPRKLITLFSFVHCIGIPQICNDFTKARDKGFVQLFDDVHSAFAELVHDNPDVDFIVKPKWGGDVWLGEIEYAFNLAGISTKDLPNLQILPDADAQEVILESDVVIGFGSTVLLEAAIAKKPVIIPHFAEADQEEYIEYVLLQDDYAAFDIAHSKDEIKTITMDRLAHPVVPGDVLTLRNEVFEKYVSPVNANASERYAETIKDVIRKHQS